MPLLEQLGARLAALAREQAAGTAGAVRAELRVVGRPSRAFLSPQGGGVGLLRQVIAETTGTAPELSTGGGTSDARFIAAYCPVAECGLPGPSMHQADEHVAVADVGALTELYRAFIARFLAGESAD